MNIEIVIQDAMKLVVDLWDEAIPSSEKLARVAKKLEPVLEHLDDEAVKLLPAGFAQFIGGIIVDNPLTDALERNVCGLIAEALYQAVKAMKSLAGGR